MAQVPDVVAPPPRHPRFPLLDGMRAVAVLTVVLVHAAVFGGAIDSSLPGRLLAHLNIGVTIFFLLSGFLLYRPFIAHRAGGAPAPEVLQYAKRRLLRIYPAYWLLLAVLVIVPGQTGLYEGQWLAHLSLLHTLPVGAGDAGCVNQLFDCGLAQTWSLSVEVTFYALLPLYVLVAARVARGRSVGAWMRAELLLLGALAAASIAARALGLEVGPRSWAGGTVISFVFWFALGMGLAVASVALDGRERPPAVVRMITRRPGLPWLLAVGVYVLLSLRLPSSPFLVDRGDQLVIHLAFGLIAALLMLPAIFGDSSGGLPRRLLRHPLVAWLGLISYGIFLWHYAIALELGSGGEGLGFWPVLAGTLALTIPIAALSYYALERPILRLKYRRLRDVLAPGPSQRRAP